MSKHELLKSVGFTDEYLEHLRKAEENDFHTMEVPEYEFTATTFDTTTLIINESFNGLQAQIKIGDEEG